MNTNVELKDEITFDEYKAWLIGLLRGKGNQLPDLNDWKTIKKMTDKVVPDIVEVQNPMIPIYVPTPTYEQPEPLLPWWKIQPMCEGSINQDSDDITFTTKNSAKISIDSAGDMSITTSTISVSGSPYGDSSASQKSIQDYDWDTNKYTILPTNKEPELAPMTELTLAQELCIKLMDEKKVK